MVPFIIASIALTLASAGLICLEGRAILLENPAGISRLVGKVHDEVSGKTDSFGNLVAHHQNAGDCISSVCGKDISGPRRWGSILKDARRNTAFVFRKRCRCRPITNNQLPLTRLSEKESGRC